MAMAALVWKFMFCFLLWSKTSELAVQDIALRGNDPNGLNGHIKVKSEFIQLLDETPSVDSQSRWMSVKGGIEDDTRYQAVPNDSQREDWFNEYKQNLIKDDFMQLLQDTPDITSASRLEDVDHKISHDPRYKAVDSDAARQKWFKEYVDDMVKSDCMQLLHDTPAIQCQSTWPELRQEIDIDPRFQAVGSENLRVKWFNEYIDGLASH